MKKCLSLGAVLLLAAGLASCRSGIRRQPVIDAHMHSQSLQELRSAGPNPATGKKAPESVAEHINQTLTEMDRYNSAARFLHLSPEQMARHQEGKQ